jgi:LacI family transcriptional regulator
MARTVTIKDVAAALGISAATVSRALAEHPRIPEGTRIRVREMAETLGYTANRAAQNLVRGGGTGFVGLVLADPGYGREDSYLSEFITGLGKGLSDLDADLFVSAIPEGKSELSVIENIVRSQRADGLVLARTAEADPRVDFLLRKGFPFVTHGRVIGERLPFPWVDTDGHAAFAQAFDMLHALGHRHFGLVTIEEPMMFRQHRTEGLRAALEAKGDPSTRLTIATAPRYAAQRRAEVIRDMLARADRPTAILCLFDGLALTVLAEAAAMGLQVPADISVIGFDNIASAAHARPGLTTFDSDTIEGGRRVAQMLVERIGADAQTAAQTHLIHPRLILRGSHGPAPQRPPD